MKLLIASNNNHKIIEIKQILDQFTLLSGKDFGKLIDVTEDKDSIEGNAEKKALEFAKYYGLYTIADDTGLFVESIENKPGVYSARFAGENCSEKDNRKKLLLEMRDKDNRKACFKTAVSFASPQEVIKTVVGVVEGEILYEEKGKNGFGYDSIFKPNESIFTFAEMEDNEKNKISHRGRALYLIKPFIMEFFRLKGEKL